MSIFAGCCRVADAAPCPVSSGRIESALNIGGLRVSRFASADATIVHASIGVLAETGWAQCDGVVAALAGSLHLNGSSCARQLECVAGQVASGSMDLLAGASGTFGLVCYSTESRRLTLAADCLGALPVYYAEHGGWLFFATTLRFFERLHEIPKTPELAAFAEQHSLYYPLGGRTVYSNIQVLTDNQFLTVSNGRVVTGRYFDWRSLPLAGGDLDEMAFNARNALREAVAVRAGNGAEEISLLSGGLDSRVIVSELLDLGRPVKTVTLAREGSRDFDYSRRFAAAAGVPLDAVPCGDTCGLTAGESTAQMLTAALKPLAGRVVFSGDGGGETLGFLLLGEATCQRLASGDVAGACAYHAGKYPVPRSLFQPDVYEGIRGVAADRLRQQVESFGIDDPEKAFHFGLILNDMRCHMHEYFNRLEEIRVELLLPFYDRRVVASVLGMPAPLSRFLGHRFYSRVLGLLPRTVFLTPWQAYPWSVPCPVPDDSPLPDQWTSASRRCGEALALRALSAAVSSTFPPFLRRTTVAGAALLHWLRRGDYGYLFKTALLLSRYSGDGQRWVIRDDGRGPE